MKILALDSSGLVASVAVAEDDILVAEYDIQYKKTHSQTLLPMTDELTRSIELDLKTLDAIAVAAGPGSFTGLRIGSATAKGLGLALALPLVEVPTLEGLAYNLYGAEGIVCPLMDARRGQVYTGGYCFRLRGQSFQMETRLAQRAVSVEELAEELNRFGEQVIFTGDGVPVYREQLTGLLKVPFSFAPLHLNRQRAASIAALGMIYYREGKTVAARDHVPVYLRLSQAEREKKEKERRQA